jgi:hypothetical protein
MDEHPSAQEFIGIVEEYARVEESDRINPSLAPRSKVTTVRAPRRLGFFFVFEAELELDPILHDFAALYAGR